MLTYCLQKQEIHSSTEHSILNGDRQVDDRDIRALIDDILATRLGDTDSDGDGVVVCRDICCSPMSSILLVRTLYRPPPTMWVFRDADRIDLECLCLNEFQALNTLITGCWIYSLTWSMMMECLPSCR